MNLVINGTKMGIYAMEEHFSKEMIEANQRREGVVVNFDDSLLWKKFPKDLVTNVEWNSIFRSSTPVARNSARIEKSAMLNDQKLTALNLLRCVQENKLPASKIFDSEKLGRFLAITRLWQAERALLFGDINFYFNPVTCLLEPIGFDGNPKLNPKSPYCYFSHGDIKDNWVNFALTDPRIASAYIRYLFRFCQSKFRETLVSEFGEFESKVRNLLLRELIYKSPAIIWKNHLNLMTYSPWSVIDARRWSIIEELSESEIVQVFAKPIPHNQGLEIRVRNKTTQPLELEGFHTVDGFTPAQQTLVSKSNVKSWGDKSIILFGQGNGWKQTSNDLLFKFDRTGIYLKNSFMPKFVF